MIAEPSSPRSPHYLLTRITRSTSNGSSESTVGSRILEEIEKDVEQGQTVSFDCTYAPKLCSCAVLIIHASSSRDHLCGYHINHTAFPADRLRLLGQAVTGAQFDDPNLDPDYIDDFDDESPYPEVRSAVANTDDPDMPVSTLRVWIIGLTWAVVLPGLNQLFYFRYPSVVVDGIVALLVTWPIGQAVAKWTPRWKIMGISINPCERATYSEFELGIS